MAGHICSVLISVEDSSDGAATTTVLTPLGARNAGKQAEGRAFPMSSFDPDHQKMSPTLQEGHSISVNFSKKLPCKPTKGMSFS